MPKLKISNETFWVIFKHCVLSPYSMISLLSLKDKKNGWQQNLKCIWWSKITFELPHWGKTQLLVQKHQKFKSWIFEFFSNKYFIKYLNFRAKNHVNLDFRFRFSFGNFGRENSNGDFFISAKIHEMLWKIGSVILDGQWKIFCIFVHCALSSLRSCIVDWLLHKLFSLLSNFLNNNKHNSLSEIYVKGKGDGEHLSKWWKSWMPNERTNLWGVTHKKPRGQMRCT